MNRRLFQSVREFKKESVLSPVFVILEVLMEVLIPLMMAKIIDVGIMNGDMGYIIGMGAVLVAMAMPVSYTHLDVYKRQVFLRPARTALAAAPRGTNKIDKWACFF